MKEKFKKIQNALISGTVLLICSCNNQHSTVRENLNFNANWKFERDDSPDYKLCEFDDKTWRILDLPHDWSVEEKFDGNNPSGIEGGALPGGVGWYRKTFILPKSDSSKRICITFDGIYQNSEVYINGILLGKRPNGNISFQYDLTPYLKYGDKNRNVISVRVDNADQPNSRWHTGSGIYRNVWLLKTNPIHIDLWGTHITTPKVSEEFAEVKISIAINNRTSCNERLQVETRVLDRRNKTMDMEQVEIEVAYNSIQEIQQLLVVNSPALWSIENPYLYKVVSCVKLKNKIIDITETPFGIRNFNYNSENGFSRKGKATSDGLDSSVLKLTLQ